MSAAVVVPMSGELTRTEIGIAREGIEVIRYLLPTESPFVIVATSREWKTSAFVVRALVIVRGDASRLVIWVDLTVTTAIAVSSE
jgi:hypothetical protein